MTRSKRCWWLLLAGLAVVPVVVWAYDCVATIYWVGSTDLEVHFIATDSGTKQPVEGAKILVHSEGGLYRDRDKKDFTLETDNLGRARQVCFESMSFGTLSGFGFTNTFVVHLPWWQFRATAPCYKPSKQIHLDAEEYISQVQRVGPNAAKLVVEVSIQKEPD
jgi:hypothetical protein